MTEPGRNESASVVGFADGELEPLRNAFARIAGSQSPGAVSSFAVYRDGTPVVDLVSGGERPWQIVFSVSKAVAAIAAQHAHSAGLLDLDAPIASVWPEFARPSTSEITTRMVLTHRAGLPAVDARLSVAQLVDGELERAVAVQEPYWAPGTQHGYHTLTYGALLDGTFRRGLGRTVAEYIHENLALPLGLGMRLGVAASDVDRVTPYRRDREVTTTQEVEYARSSEAIVDGSGLELWSLDCAFNRADVLQAGWPASNLVSTARDLARLFAATLATVDGVRLIDEAALAELVAPRSVGVDQVLGFPIAFGSGVQLPFPQCPFLGPTSFGQEGANGCVAFADIATGVSAAFTTTAYPSSNGAAPGATALFASLRQCLERSA